MGLRMPLPALFLLAHGSSALLQQPLGPLGRNAVATSSFHTAPFSSRPSLALSPSQKQHEHPGQLVLPPRIALHPQVQPRHSAVIAAEVPPALEQSARSAASLGGIVAVDIALRKLFVARSIAFPSSLAGMLLLFSSLCALQKVRPSAASAVFDAARPGCAIISAWLACFFVPNLVLLPIVLRLSAADAWRLALLVASGALVALPVCASSAVVAESFFSSSKAADDGRDAVASAAASVETAATSMVESADDAAPDPTLSSLARTPAGRLSSWSAGLGVAALLARWTTGSLAARFAGPLRDVYFLMCTLAGFEIGKALPSRVQKLLHPLITCTLVTIGAVSAFAAFSGQRFASVLRSYLVPGGAPLAAPGNLLLFMLGPATFSFGFQMFERRRLMLQSAAAVGASTFTASTFGLFGSAAAARLLGLSAALRLAVIPRQVTAPLAIAISAMIGADPSLAATVVVVTGLIVANFGQSILDTLKIRSPVSRGLAMGCAGHGIGTAAMAQERAAFPFAAIALALNAALSTILVSLPPVRRALLATAGAMPSLL